MNPHVPELVCDCRLELFLRQLVDEVLFDRQQKSSAGVQVISTETVSVEAAPADFGKLTGPVR